MKYKIVTAYYAKQLEILVNKQIRLGWKPQGGVSVSHGPIAAQALIKIDRSKKK